MPALVIGSLSLSSDARQHITPFIVAGWVWVRGYGLLVGEWVVTGASVGAWAGWPRHHQHHTPSAFVCEAMRVREQTLHGGRMGTGRWVWIGKLVCC